MAVFTPYENGSPTALSCTIDLGGTTVACSDPSDTVPVTAGDTISLEVLNPNAQLFPTISWAVQTS